MAELAPIQIKYKPVTNQPAYQFAFPGAQTEIGKRGWFKNIADSTFVIQTHEGMAIFTGKLFMCQGIGTGFQVINIETGLIDTEWNHAFAGGNLMSVLATKDYLYVGGNFQSIDGITSIASRPVNGVCRFDRSGALDTSWNPYPADTGGDPPAISGMWENPINGTLLISGVNMKTLNGVARNIIGEVSINDAGNATSWDPNPSNAVYKAVPDEPNNRIYLAGAFSTIKGASRPGLARVNTTDGTSDATYIPNPDAVVRDIILDWETEYIYAVGDFSNIGGAARAKAALIKDDATAATWNPTLNGTGSKVIRYNDIIFLLGAFTTISATTRNRIGAVTAGMTATLLSWDPGANEQVWTGLLLDKTVYVGGQFTTLQGQSKNYVGRVHYPIFTDSNTKHIAKSGSDANSGTAAAPYLTIQKAFDNLSGAFCYALILDSGIYRERPTITYSANEVGGLYAAEGQAPTIEGSQGAFIGTYGARKYGRIKFSSGAPSTFYSVAKWGNDGTGTRGDPNLPFLTIQAALNDGSRASGDTIEILDSAPYIEQLNLGTGAITIQAKDGQVPVISYATDVNIISVTDSASFYGITFVGNQISTSFNAIVSINATGPKTFEFYDCTFMHHACQIKIENNTGSTLDIYNSQFSDNLNAGIYLTNGSLNQGFFNVENSFFEYGGLRTDYASGPTYGDILIFSNASGVDNCTHKIQNSTFRNSFQYSCINIGGAPSPTGGSTLVNNCLFDSNIADEDKYDSSGVIIAGFSGTSMTVKNCQAKNLGGYGFIVGVLDAGTSITLENLLADSCQAVDAYYFIGTNYGAISSDINAGTIKDCAAINCGRKGFRIIKAGTGGTVVIKNLCSINAPLGYECGSGLGTINSILEKGGSQINNASGFANSIIENGITGGPGYGYKKGDPRFISDAPGAECIALSGNSRGLGNSTEDLEHIGHQGYLLNIIVNAHEFTVDGLIISGNKNMASGIKTSAETNIINCTFNGLGVQGIHGRGRFRAINNYFEVFGIGLYISSAIGEIRGNVFNQCGSVGLLVGSSGYNIRNNTAYGCQFGQFDFGNAGSNYLSSNVYAGSGMYDYQGNSIQYYSCIPELSDNAELLYGSQRDPMFRNPEADDLRLQSISAGYYYDSVAVGLGEDGLDAGAYQIIYGLPVTSWTLINFSTEGWRNPSNVERESVPVKLAQGYRHNGSFFSRASDFRRLWRLIWNEDTDMPNAQVEALLDLYQSEGGILQISFNGGNTWNNAIVDREEPVIYRELAGMTYANDEIPTPINTLVIRETND